MTVLPQSRVRVFFVVSVFYISGVAAAALTSIPSALAVSTIFVAAATWAFGWQAGLAAIAVEKLIAFILFHTGTLSAGVSPVAILVPTAFTNAVVLLTMVALRRAEFRQAAIEAELREKNAELEATLSEVKDLQGMLPICAWCKGIRDVNGMWSQLEAYIAKHSRATLTHGICPTCLARLANENQALPPTG